MENKLQVVENRTDVAQKKRAQGLTFPPLCKQCVEGAINLTQMALKQACNNFFGSAPGQTKGLCS